MRFNNAHNDRVDESGEQVQGKSSSQSDYELTIGLNG